MDLHHSVLNQRFEVTMTGEFTFADHAAFRRILERMQDQAVSQVIFSLEHLAYVDSAALGMFLLALDVAEKNNKPLRLIGANGQVKKIFGMARLDKLFVMA